jgi:hypothetical protein
LVGGSVGDEGGGGRAEESAAAVDGRMAVWLSGGDAAGAVGGCRVELKGRRPGGRRRMTKRMKRREVARGGRLGRYEDAAEEDDWDDMKTLRGHTPRRVIGGH